MRRDRLRCGVHLLAALTIGCGATPSTPPLVANTAVSAHVQALAGHSNGALAVSGGAGLALEFPGCCGLGGFASSTRHRGASGTSSIAVGGLELSAELPVVHNLRLAGRVGRAGTQPTSYGTSSSGYLAGVSLALRLPKGQDPVLVGTGQGRLELVLSYEGWQLRGYSPAGPSREESNGHAVLVGIRFGGAYGLDLY